MFRRFFALAFAANLLVLSLPVHAQDGAKPQQPASKFDQLIDKKKKVQGMWTIYHSDQQMLVELSESSLKKEYIIIPSIARGISRGMVLGGMSWGFGDDAIWAFKKSEEKIYVIQRNVRFRAKPNTPEANAVQLAYSDSVLYSLPILTKTPSGGYLVDMTHVFMNDELQVGNEIGPGFRYAQDRSTISSLKAFPENVEIQINAVYSGNAQIDTVPNSKGVQVGVHYSVSVLPPVGSNGYKPRIADDRVGYFLTAIKDFSEADDPDHFVRYINRWNLQKLDPSLDVSPPKEQIEFYIEDTVPVFLRPTVEAGILEWNKAFEKIGFAGAIKVNRQPSDPNFDPENIRYNTFRWMTAEAGFAMGPSRVDPRTGQILDADIIFDASFLDSWSQRWETFRGETPESPPETALLLQGYRSTTPFMGGHVHVGHRHSATCNYCVEKQRYNGFAAAFFAATGATSDGSLPKEFIHQGMKEVVMHEVGHTLGLRHNFKASAWKSLEQINDKTKGLEEGIVASVMDYTPANISPDKDNQGLYYTQTIGPYDYWAIEYGYKPISGNEKAELQKIASRSTEPGLAYTTDEDTRSIDPDPYSARFDLGQNPLEFATRQMEMTKKALPEILNRVVKDGEGYQKARQAFMLLFHEYWSAISTAAKYPGGIVLSRDHKGAKDARPPFTTVSAQQQRDAMKLINESAFEVPELSRKDLNYLAVSRWSHWGTGSPFRLDFPIHDEILIRQDNILARLLGSNVLFRIQDNEYKAEPGEDVYTLAEHLKLLDDGIFTEWKSIPDPEKAKFDNRNPYINSFRRNLQRQALRRLGTIVAQPSVAPADARTLTRVQLQTLREQAQQLVDNKEIQLDDYSRAHLIDSIARINTILTAELQVPILN
jgi:hypothetical protein